MQAGRYVAALAVVALPAAAEAGDGERALGLSAVVGSLSLPDHEPAGGGLVIDLRRGVTDVIALRGAVLGAALVGDDGTSYVGQAVVGVTYALDILAYVPYVDLGVGAALVGGVVDTAIHPQVELGVGLDVLTSRTLAWGPFARLAAYADESSLVTVGLRAAVRWGYF